MRLLQDVCETTHERCYLVTAAAEVLTGAQKSLRSSTIRTGSGGPGVQFPPFAGELGGADTPEMGLNFGS
jgi:hypothetical protein